MALQFDRHKLRKLREERGISGRHIGKTVVNSPTYCSRWELGKVSPDLETIGKIADALGVPYTELITDTEAA